MSIKIYNLANGFPYSCICRICRFCRVKLAPCSANTTHTTVKYLGFPYCCICRICCFCCCNSGRTKCILGHILVVSVVSVACGGFHQQNAVVSRPFPVVSVLGDRIISISENTLYLSYLSYWAVVC